MASAHTPKATPRKKASARELDAMKISRTNAKRRNTYVINHIDLLISNRVDSSEVIRYEDQLYRSTSKCRDTHNTYIDAAMFDPSQRVVEDGWLLGVEKSSEKCHKRIDAYVKAAVAEQANVNGKPISPSPKPASRPTASSMKSTPMGNKSTPAAPSVKSTPSAASVKSTPAAPSVKTTPSAASVGSRHSGKQSTASSQSKSSSTHRGFELDRKLAILKREQAVRQAQQEREAQARLAAALAAVDEERRRAVIEKAERELKDNLEKLRLEAERFDTRSTTSSVSVRSGLSNVSIGTVRSRPGKAGGVASETPEPAEEDEKKRSRAVPAKKEVYTSRAVDGPATCSRTSPEVTVEVAGADSWIDEAFRSSSPLLPACETSKFYPWLIATLPRLEVPKFDGDPRNWLEFISSFKTLIHDVVPTNAQRLAHLKKYLDPKVRASIGKILNDPSQYARIMAHLKSRYGAPHKVSRAHFKALLEIKQCKSDDLESLTNFWYELRGCIDTFEQNGNEADICSGTNVEMLAERLPPVLQGRWGRYQRRMLPKIATLRTLDEFLEDYIEGEELGRPVRRAVASSGKFDGKPSTKDEHHKGRPSRPPTVRAMADPKLTSGPGTMPGPSTHAPRPAGALPKSTPDPSPKPRAEASRKLPSCFACGSEEHNTVACDEFLKLEPKGRAELATAKGYCFRCLAGKHRGRDCPESTKCRVEGCKYPHHTLIHGAPRMHPLPPVDASTTIRATRTERGLETRTSMEVVPVMVMAGALTFNTYAFLDAGADGSLIREDLARRLGLPIKKEKQRFGDIFDGRMVDTCVVDFQVRPVHGGPTFNVQLAHTVPSFNAPDQTLDFKAIQASFPHLQGIDLPSVSASEITILIGQDVPCAHEQIEFRKPPVPESNDPVAVRTHFGWCLAGRVQHEPERQAPRIRRLCCPENVELQELVSNFWTIESLGVKSGYELRSHEEKRALDLLKTSTRNVGNRYEAPLLWKSPESQLPNNYNVALRRLYSVERRFRSDSHFAARYASVIEEHIRLGHATIVPDTELNGPVGRTWFLPHHGVINPNKPEKLRVVFDASAEYRGHSLNKALLKGPDLTTSLFGVLIRFRRFRYAVSADIEKMFYQVLVSEVDRSALRFLWRSPGSTNSAQMYRMNVQVFGAVSSPTICAYVLRATAEDNGGEFADVVDRVQNCFYVDNYLDSFEFEQDAVNVPGRVTELLQRGGFRLNQWISSSRTALAAIPTTERADPLLDIDGAELPSERTLGLLWDCEADAFKFKFRYENDGATKRDILSSVMKIFDPLGFLAPITIEAKMILQDVWRQAIDWDQELPREILSRWEKWAADLPIISKLLIPRCLWSQFDENSQLHAFSDASSSAYGAVVYLRYVVGNEIKIRFVAAKAFVSPIRELTIPKLELQGALAAYRLANQVATELRIPKTSITYWSDSRTALLWVHSIDFRFQTFVANRVGEILEGSDPRQWRHVPGVMNPADDCSRGISATQLSAEHRWFTGPAFLQEPESAWPARFTRSPSDVADESTLFIRSVQSPGSVRPGETNMDPFDDITTKLANIIKLQRIVAWVLRAIEIFRSCNKFRPPSYLTALEIRQAVQVLLRAAQKKAFRDDISHLSTGKRLPSNSRLLKLDPFLDEVGLLRVGGRLERGSYAYEMKHPVILPSQHPLTDMIIDRYHWRYFHSRTERLLSELRSKYWILRGRDTVKRIVNRCFTCKRKNSKPNIPLMAALPPHRLPTFPDRSTSADGPSAAPPNRAFARTGVDFFGPFTVSIRRSTEKRYGCLFCCLETRAVHLEMAYSLDVDSFLLAFRRFTSRRGTPLVMYSDNGTNFVAGERELREGIARWNHEVIVDQLAQDGIEWHFNPPAAPHFGGVWERLVRSCVDALWFVLQDRTTKDEVLLTAMVEVEAHLNDRPLTHVSVDPSEPEAITPNHLIYGHGRLRLPPDVFNPSEVNSRRRWRAVQALLNEHWIRWMKEYVPALTERRKWLRPARNIEENDIVLIIDPSTPRGLWPTGRVIRTFPGADGVVRSAVVKNKNGEYRRPVAKLCLLEAASESHGVSQLREETGPAMFLTARSGEERNK